MTVILSMACSDIFPLLKIGCIFTVMENVMPVNSQQNSICLETILTCLLYFNKRIERILDFKGPT